MGDLLSLRLRKTVLLTGSGKPKTARHVDEAKARHVDEAKARHVDEAKARDSVKRTLALGPPRRA